MPEKLQFYTIDELVNAGELSPAPGMAPRHTLPPGTLAANQYNLDRPENLEGTILQDTRTIPLNGSPLVWDNAGGADWSPGQIPIFDQEHAPETYDAPIIDMRRNRWKAYLPWLAVAGIVFVLWYLSRQ
jgi:hypothetical protein